MEEKLVFTIKPDGSTKIEVYGVKGGSCKTLTKDIEEALGKTVSDRETPEMRETVGQPVYKNQR